MKTKALISLLLISSVLPVVNAKDSQSTLAKVENRLDGALDYTKEQLSIVHRQINGKELALGTIKKDGVIQFTLPTFDIKALHKAVMAPPVTFNSWFSTDANCMDVGFSKKPGGEIYSRKYDQLYIKKYGQKIATLSSVTDKKILSGNRYSSNTAIGSEYYWLYIDRDLNYQDSCTLKSFDGTYDVQVDIHASMNLKEGWNFIEERLVESQEHIKGNYKKAIPRRIKFSESLPSIKKVKWFIEPVMDDEKIQAARKLYESASITEKDIEIWLPTSLNGLKRSHYKLYKPGEHPRNLSVTALFEDGDKELEINLIDLKRSPRDIEMVRFAFAMQADSEGNSEADVKTISNRETHHILQDSDDENTQNLLALFESRVALSASGKHMNSDELWQAIEKMDVKALIK